MYHPPGEYVTDFCIVEHDGLYHLFHIRGERWTWSEGYRELDLGHATSTDLCHWAPHEPVLPAGPAGAWDECGNWAPDIIEAHGVFYCFYTGSDRANNQAIGLATSTDLYRWTKHEPNPVVVPGPWSDRHVGRDVAGRDAMVFRDHNHGRYLMYYTATMADGRACIALAQSTDLVHWDDLGPTYVEENRSYNRLESAYLVEHDRRYYLFYSAKGGPNSKGHAPDAFDHFDIVYLTSDDPTGGWTRPRNHELLTEWTCASEHPTFDGVTYMLYIIQEEIEGVWGASVLSDPKRLAWLQDGAVSIREHLPANSRVQSIFDSESETFERWIMHGGDWQANGQGEVAISGVSEHAFLVDTLWGRDLTIAVQVSAGPHSTASLMVRTTPSALAGYRISLDFEQGLVGIYLHMPDRPLEMIQERDIDLLPHHWHRLKVVVKGEFLEIYVDEALWIVRHHRTCRDGCYGLHARGEVRFRNLSVYHTPQETSQEESRGDWLYRCLPRHLCP